MTSENIYFSEKLLSTSEEIQDLYNILKNEKIIALDTEFIREHTFFPIIALIQVATKTSSWLIDPIALSAQDLEPFFRILNDPNILKVFHAAQADQECLYTNFKKIAKPCFDTAVAASLCGYGDSIGLARLVKDHLGIVLQKGHSRTDWTVRPLPKQLAEYAHLDVHYLIPMAEKLLQELDEKGRKSWAFELCSRLENTEAFEVNAKFLANKIARRVVKSKSFDPYTYAALIELVEWRERRVRDLDVPRKRVADDQVLVDLAIVKPKDAQHLSAFRGLSPREMKQSVKDILAAIQKSQRVHADDLPEVPTIEVPEAHEARAVEIVQCYVRYLADELKIASKHLMNTDDILKLIRADFQKVEELVGAEILTEGAAQLIGKDLLDLVRGNRSLGLSRSGLVVYNKESTE